MKEVQTILEFVNHYRKMISYIIEITKSLIEFIKKNIK